MAGTIIAIIITIIIIILTISLNNSGNQIRWGRTGRLYYYLFLRPRPSIFSRKENNISYSGVDVMMCREICFTPTTGVTEVE